MIIRVVGMGMGPGQLTADAVAALRDSAYVVAAAKEPTRRSDAEDPLLAVRREVCAAHGLELVAVPDPERERDVTAVAGAGDYDRAVRDWHAARADAWAVAIGSRSGDPALLVWGDPSLYDSALRIAWALADRLGADVEVVPGVSAPQVLAARHRLVLHRLGEAVHVTTERRLAEDIAAGQRNLVVMLTSGRPVPAPADWSIWWGANLGTPAERLLAGRVGEVAPDIAAAREAVRAEAGWVMDVYLLRAPAEDVADDAADGSAGGSAGGPA